MQILKILQIYTHFFLLFVYIIIYYFTLFNNFNFYCMFFVIMNHLCNQRVIIPKTKMSDNFDTILKIKSCIEKKIVSNLIIYAYTKKLFFQS